MYNVNTYCDRATFALIAGLVKKYYMYVCSLKVPG
jgi:hypothetical protein